MSRSVIARLFYGSLLAILVAIVLLIAALVVAVNTSSFVMHGNDVVGIRSGLGWVLVATGAVAVLIIIAASVAQFVAWIGALINTAPLESKTWFVLLLVGGILGFGLIVMLVYLLTDTSGEGRPSPHAPPAVRSAN